LAAEEKMAFATKLPVVGVHALTVLTADIVQGTASIDH
jgi:hypothetical protein